MIYICGLPQEEVTEDEIDDSFKSMFAQLAGEVSSEKQICLTFTLLTSFYIIMFVVVQIRVLYIIVLELFIIPSLTSDIPGCFTFK